MRVRPQLRRPHKRLAAELVQLRPRNKPVILEVGLALFLELFLCGTDAVATRGLSCDHEDAIDAKWHRDDAIAATTSR